MTDPLLPGTTESSELSTQVSFRPAYSKQSMALIGLFILACLYTLYFAKVILLPIVVAILLNFLLYPLIRVGKKFKIPEPMTALLIVILLLFSLIYGFYSLSSPAQEWLSKAPENFSQLGVKIESLIHPLEKPLKGFANIKEQIQKSTEISTTKHIPEVTVKPLSSSPFNLLLTTSSVFFIQIGFVIFLLYFLLSSGDFFLLKTVALLPNLSQKKEAVMASREIREEINRFLFIKFWTGLCLAGVISIIFFFLGMPHPILWGILAGVLEFIPYIGVTIGTILTFLSALLIFDNLTNIILVPLSFFTVTTLTGNFFVPLMLSRGLLLHPVMVFLSVIFGGWIWGVAGALIAVPMLSILKIICNNIKSLTNISKFLEK